MAKLKHLTEESLAETIERQRKVAIRNARHVLDEAAQKGWEK